MSRVIAIIAAVSVCWHTTAGCCAHHDHAESAGNVATAVAGECDHDHHTCDPASHPEGGLPNSQQCQDGTCAFTVPDAPLSIEFDAPGSGFFLSDGLLNDRTLLGQSALSDTLVSSPPFLLGALPRHLALGVLLL